MTDLTKITEPFGLLDAETQEALRAHGGAYEFFSIVGWVDKTWPTFVADRVYRVKPQPPKPREWWLVISPASKGYMATAFQSPRAAQNTRQPEELIVHVREVTDE